MFKSLIKKALAKAGYTVLHVRSEYLQDGLFTVHNDHFRDSDTFREAYRRGMAASHGFDPEFEWRVHVALWAAATSLHVPGDFVECGVNAGFISSAIMQRLRWQTVDRKFYLIDTFSGPVLDQYSPEEVEHGRLAVARDALNRGAYVTDLDRTRANYSEWPNAVIVQGVIPEVLSTLKLGPVAFLHIDLNCAYPERMALEFFWNVLSRGGMILLDDYAYLGYESQAKAIDELAAQIGAEILSLPTGQGLILK